MPAQDTLKQPFPYSLPKEKIKILLLEGISETAVNILRAAGYTHIDRRTDGARRRGAARGTRRRAPARHPLAHADHGRSDRRHPLAGGDRLLLRRHQPGRPRRLPHLGVPVFNAPFSNTRWVAELIMAEIVMLMRRIFPKSRAAHAGGWDKSAVGSHEVRGKTLGIVGYGNIGTQSACSPRRWACA